jgi:hypothetical protein
MKTKVIGRPPLVSDAEIIAAGERIKSAGPVNGTQLWRACGGRGRAERLLAVWDQHEAKLRAEAGDDQQIGGAGLAIPEKAQQMAAILKGDLSSGIDRVLSSIFSAVEVSVQSRYQAEVSEMTRARDAYLSEIHDAYAAMEEKSEAASEAEDRVKAVEGALTDALNARNVSDALRTAAIEEQARLVERLRQVDRELKHELLARGEAKAAAARVESEAEELRRTVQGTKQELDTARAEIKQALFTSAALHDTNSRQAEAVALKDVEINRMRELASKTEIDLQAWMERAFVAERAQSKPLTKQRSSNGSPTGKEVRRRRANARSDQASSEKATGSVLNGAVALVADASEQQASIVERSSR